MGSPPASQLPDHALRDASAVQASSKRRRKFFLDCISSLWNLVIESASSDSDASSSAELRNILVGHVSPLLQCIPATGKRLLLPSWIPKDKLRADAAADADSENTPPASITPRSCGRPPKKLRSPEEQAAGGADSDGEDLPLTEF
ncbi:unnamed protein product, partial [Dibothriocephalus latus]